MKSPLIVFFLFLFYFSVLGQETSKMIDPRDGKVYNTVDLNIVLEGGIYVHRVWIAENLNFKTEKSVCYKDEPAYCNKFGMLYNWEDVQTVCPQGWHLASEKEWKEAIETFGGLYSAGKSLKAEGSSNLNMILGGFGDAAGNYSDVGRSANYWVQGETIKLTAPMKSVNSAHNEIGEVLMRKTNYNSCRCVENY